MTVVSNELNMTFHNLNPTNNNGENNQLLLRIAINL